MRINDNINILKILGSMLREDEVQFSRKHRGASTAALNVFPFDDESIMQQVFGLMQTSIPWSLTRARMGARHRHLPMVAGSDSHFAATVGLGVTDIQASDAQEAVTAIRAGRTRDLGKRTSPKFFIGNTVQSICVP